MVEEINIYWPDATIRGFFCDYDAFNVEIQEDREHDHSTKTLRCLGFLGFQMVGFWDEVIIQSAAVHESHPFIVQCESRVTSQLPSGSSERTAVNNRLLEVELIDGCRLWVCAHRFVVESRELK